MNVSCNKDSGKCNHGCKNGYSGDMCCINSHNCLFCKNYTAFRECESGYFGQTCSKTCSDLCINNVCESITGICTEGCIAVLDNPICAESKGKYSYFTKTKICDLCLVYIACKIHNRIVVIVMIFLCVKPRLHNISFVEFKTNGN
jgi:hypothetical protein